MKETKSEPGHLVNSPAIGALYGQAALPGAAYRDFAASASETRLQFRQGMSREPSEEPAAAQDEPASAGRPQPCAQREAPQISEPIAGAAPDFPPAAPCAGAAGGEEDLSPPIRPQWLSPPPQPVDHATPAAVETLQQAGERVASRWFAFQDMLAPLRDAIEPPSHSAKSHPPPPVTAIFSVAGGVGKTMIAATLGRALAARGERILLADTTARGLLPFYFGSRESKPGARIFAPPGGSGDAPVHLLTVDPESCSEDDAAGESPQSCRMIEAILREAHGCGRILVDIATGASALMRRMLPLEPSVLVPLLPDISSVVSVGDVEAVFAASRDRHGHTIAPVYVLNRFEPSLPLHLDVREILRGRLGDRLLPFELRGSPAVGEALAEGMTVLDYAPASASAEDYAPLADWLRSASAPAAAGIRGLRWSEL